MSLTSLLALYHEYVDRAFEACLSDTAAKPANESDVEIAAAAKPGDDHKAQIATAAKPAQEGHHVETTTAAQPIEDGYHVETATADAHDVHRTQASATAAMPPDGQEADQTHTITTATMLPASQEHQTDTAAKSAIDHDIETAIAAKPALATNDLSTLLRRACTLHVMNEGRWTDPSSRCKRRKCSDLHICKKW